MKYFKVKLKIIGGSLESFILIRAKSIGEAVVIADNRSEGSHFELCDDPATEISRFEYRLMVKGHIES
ncbi:hypothetical protein [Pontibacter pamirensis]|uniref:hypothetical protein n=1 Tax=Pontibacter pamirensis TaxID=2562824 RepID=UPI001F2323E4|nr:hypothetical protein [Pontibacter pamirensis]